MVTILGGGIAGTVLAGALAREGHQAIVYERRPNVRGGAFLFLDGRAHRTLTELGVPADELERASYPTTGFRVSSPAEEMRENPAAGHRLYHRTDLMRVLTEFADDSKAEIHYGTAITDLDPDTGVLYPGGTAAELVIAADGIDSIARTRLEPARQPEYAGQVVLYATAAPGTRPNTAPSVLHFHRRVDASPATFGHFWNDQVTVWFVRLTREPIPVGYTGFHPLARWIAPIRQALPTIPFLLDTLLEATTMVHVSNARTVPLTRALPPRAPVILCGDADHALSPAAGVGARDAIEDAAALCRALLSGADPAAAMRRRREEVLAVHG
ncbi:FAD-dependent monooxygenase [Nocardia sp. NEAU-G5]|uniref:FAD-dependent monooxygenase n=1 Tax=Nocardia albiluteola TaxID=2842303 RepID=A0ABS6B2U2_9NOCA|nr:NAD(P)/FAD-dependent oxidoreductase [Nocardia albiluteola]MBU3063640.1 FAD-dependent monooxygenase [Nocardia albiluteola]